jgi:acid phosphatase (class A)
MAYSREIIGVHFPSDSEAGRLLARQLVNLFLQSSSFRKDLSEAKKEIQKMNSRKDIGKKTLQ